MKINKLLIVTLSTACFLSYMSLPADAMLQALPKMIQYSKIFATQSTALSVKELPGEKDIPKRIPGPQQDKEWITKPDEKIFKSIKPNLLEFPEINMVMIVPKQHQNSHTTFSMKERQQRIQEAKERDIPTLEELDVQMK